MFERWLSSAEDGHFCFFAGSRPLRAGLQGLFVGQDQTLGAGLQSAKARHRPKVVDKARKVAKFSAKGTRTFYG